MKTEVSLAIEELRRQFDAAALTVKEDGQGGAYVVIEPVSVGARYEPQTTWIGFQIPAQYPYADVYPVFVSGDLRRVDNVAFVAPVTPGHQFQGRVAIQVSRRSAAALNGSQTVT